VFEELHKLNFNPKDYVDEALYAQDGLIQKVAEANVTKEDFVVCVSGAGYVKKHSLKVMAANENEYPVVKEGDYIEGFYKVNNLDTILLFTNYGNYLYLPVREISESKFKDVGSHVSSIIKVSDGERIVKTIAVHNFDDSILTIFTKKGMVK
jgi:topoisomerase-4 subunit A